MDADVTITPVAPAKQSTKKVKAGTKAAADTSQQLLITTSLQTKTVGKTRAAVARLTTAQSVTQASSEVVDIVDMPQSHAAVNECDVSDDNIDDDDGLDDSDEDSPDELPADDTEFRP